MANWNKSVHGGIATAIRDARHGRFTADQLANETSRLNYPVSCAQIANYESGRKHSLDITELMVLAAALEVPALSLLFPGQPNAAVEMLPGRSTTAAQAKTEFVGDSGLLWPGTEINQLLSALNQIQSGMAGMGALTAVTQMRRTL